MFVSWLAWPLTHAVCPLTRSFIFHSVILSLVLLSFCHTSGCVPELSCGPALLPTTSSCCIPPLACSLLFALLLCSIVLCKNLVGSYCDMFLPIHRCQRCRESLQQSAKGPSQNHHMEDTIVHLSDFEITKPS